MHELLILQKDRESVCARLVLAVIIRECECGLLAAEGLWLMKDRLVWAGCCADRRGTDGGFSWYTREVEDCERARMIGFRAIHRSESYYNSSVAYRHAPFGLRI